MIELALVLPRYLDGTYAFQRRDGEAPTSRLQIGMFGGHCEAGESAEETARRELAEETSLALGGLTFRLLLKSEVPEGHGGHNVAVSASVFGTDIPESEFAVYEGIGTERYALVELLRRDDVVKTARFLLERLPEDSIV